MQGYRLCLLVTLLFLGACAPLSQQLQFTVSVDSISSSEEPLDKTYVIASGDQNTSNTNLQFIEFATQIERALTLRGYQKATPDSAAILITLAYDISAPETKTISDSIPIFGQTGVASSTTYGQVSSAGSFSGTTYNTPTFGITGYRPITRTYVSYMRMFIVSAFDIAASRRTKRDVPLWQTTVSSIGSSGDLRYVFPYMVSAASQYFGTNTGRKVTIDVKEDDTNVQLYRVGITPSKPRKIE